MQAAEEQTPDEYSKSLKGSLDLAGELAKYVDNITEGSREINKVFGQGRQRISELIGAIADATPAVNRIGGSMADVYRIMGDVAEASNRNLIASTKEVEKLAAAERVLGIDAKTMSNAFLDVGVGLQSIPEQLEKSTEYIRSIGGNTKEVMGKVVANMDQMNRYQFEGGVKGLTKMAAQASMLRFDMNETFRLADKVLDPDQAIEVASAFQRLGVSAGNLVDPFQLMNQSINDPSGLQNSLAEVAKQFTEYDSKTKTFKINPQGVLTLREMEKQTGVSAKEMSKMALAAAELDQRISAVNAAGLNIASEEDKQYLANIAKMGEGGEYEVKVTNEDGKEETKKLSDLTQTQFDNLIEEQKNGPKTLEDVARVQLNVSETIKGDVAAMKNAVLGGAASAKPVKEGIVGVQKTADVLGGEASKKFGNTESVRKEVESALDDLGSMAKDFKEGIKPATETLSDYLTKVGNQMGRLESKFEGALKEYGQSVSSKLSDKNPVESITKKGVDAALKASGNPITNNDVQPLSSSPNKSISQQTTITNQTVTTKGNVDVGGKITVEVKSPPGVSSEDLNKIMTNFVNSQEFQTHVRNITKDSNPTKAPNSTVYGD